MLSHFSRSAPGIGAVSGGGLKHKPGRARRISEVGGYSSNTYGGRVRGHVGPLPSATVTMVPGREGVEHGPDLEGGAVPDRLHPGDRP